MLQTCNWYGGIGYFRNVVNNSDIVIKIATSVNSGLDFFSSYFAHCQLCERKGC